MMVQQRLLGLVLLGQYCSLTFKKAIFGMPFWMWYERKGCFTPDLDDYWTIRD